jgi:signal transduction histidine kinase
MKIKNRLSIYFALITAVTFIIALIIVFIAFNSLVRADFYSRLNDRAKVVAQLYFKADEISADSLGNVRKRFLRQLPGEIVRIYDEKDAPVIIKDQQQYWSSKIINQVRKKRELSFTEGDRQTNGIYVNDNQGNFVILVSAIDTQGNQRLNDLIEIMIVLLVSVIACLFFIGRWFSKKALEPIDNMVRQMQMVRASNLSLRVNEGNGKDEISTLAQNFNSLLGHLENAFELQQSFVTNASHELRTPVTSIIGEVEVGLLKTRTPAEYELLLRSVLNDAERLKETITGLLELATVDMNFTQTILTPVAIDDLIWELSDYWIKRIGKSHFHVNILQLPDDPEKLQIAANKSLLTIALNNIIGNAYKFSDNEPVRCDLHADEDKISIKITDHGIGIPLKEQGKIFHSFYRATNVKGYTGNGIGLYVTSKIIELFKGSILIESTSALGTSIIIEFLRK